MKSYIYLQILLSKIAILFLLIIGTTSVFSQCETPSIYVNEAGYTQTNRYTKSFSTGTSAYSNIDYTCNSNWDYASTLTLGYADLTNTHVVSKHAGSSFSFEHHFNDNSSSLKIWVDWNKDGIFTETESVFSDNKPGSQNPVPPITGTITIPNNQALGDYVMRIRSNRDQVSWNGYPAPCGNVFEGNSAYIWGGSALDFTLRVVALPTCFPITNLTETSHTTTSVSFSWNAVTSASSYNIKWGLPGFDPENEAGIGSSTSSASTFTINGLTPETSYDIYVQANCSGNTSVWVEHINVYTYVGHCIPKYESLSLVRRLGVFSTQDALTNIEYTKTSDSIYVNRKNNILTSYAGNTINCTFINSAYNTGSQYTLFIDWNNDLDFDDVGEQMFSTPYIWPLPITQTIPFTVPTNVAPGNYTMRVSSAMQNDGLVNPCGNDAFTGSYVDFTLEIVSSPNCKLVQNLAATLNSASSVTLNWTAQNGETNWNIQYGVKGFTLGTGTTESTNGTPTHTINSLSPYTHYDFYVQANCGGSLSYWAGPISIYTGHCIPTLMDSYASAYFIQKFKTYNAIDNIHYEVNQTSSKGWIDNPTTVLTTYEGNVVNYELSANPNQAWYKIWIDWNNDLDFDDPGEDMLTLSAAIPFPDAYEGTFTVPTGTSAGTYKMRIARYISTPEGDACSTITYGNYVDFLVNVQGTTAPTCLPVYPVTVEATSYSSINMSWTAGGTETAWNIEYGAKDFTLGSGTTISANTNSYTINNLTANTYYDVYVQADCGSGNTSSWQGPFRVYTGPCVLPPINIVPANNLYINQFTTSNATQDISYFVPNIPHPGSYIDQTSTILLTNPNTQIYFTIGSGGYARKQTIWADWNNDLDFDDPGELLYTSATGSYIFIDNGYFIVPAGTPAGDYRMRVIVGNSYNPPEAPLPACSNATNTVDFTIRVVNSTACSPIILLSATPSSTTSINVSWNGTATGYTIEWGTPGFTPGTNTHIGTTSISSTSYTINGLAYGSSYDIYVKADCGSGNTSTWTAHPTVKIQPCVPRSLTINKDYTSSFSTTGGTLNGSYGPVTQNAYLGYSDLTATQIIAQDAGMSFNFSHSYYSSSSDHKSPNIVRIWIDWNQDLVFSDGEEVYNYFSTYPNDSSPWDHNGTITIPANRPAGTYIMRVRSRLASTYQTLQPCGIEDFSTTLDFTVQVTGTASCPPIYPLSLTANTASFTSADVSWTPQGTETAWNIKWGSPGFDPNISSGLGSGNSTATSYTINGLTQNTTYDIYVQANCSSDQSIWIGPVTVTTDYCTPTSSSSTNYFISGFETGNALSDINYTTSSGVSYDDQTAMNIQSYAGNVVSYNIHTSSYIGYYYIWIDWNQDLDFDDAGELMHASTVFDNVNTSYTDIFTIPSNVSNGAYRMRVAHSISNSSLNSCGSVNLGNTIDFTIVINPPPTCMPINSLQIVSTNYTSTTLSWNVQGTETLWNIEYGTSGFTQGTGTIISVNSNPTTISNLDPNTSYDFYVRANCGSDQSIWIGPLNVLTGQCVPQGLLSSTTYFVGSFVTTEAFENVNYTANSPLGYVDQTSSQITVDQNATFSYTIAQNTGSGRYFIWIDYNNDLDFDDPGETILSTIDYLTSATGTITIPSNIDVGQYKIRIANSYLNDVSSCGPAQNGNYVDFTLNVISCVATNVNAGILSGDNKLCVNNSTEITPSISGGTWSIQPSTVATIDNGTVYGQSAGTATVIYTITATNGCSATTTHPIEIVNPQTLIITGVDTLIIGEFTTFTVNSTDGSWTSSDFSITESDDSTATVTAQTTGSKQIIYTSNSVCNETTSKTVIVIEKSTPSPVGITEIDNVSDIKVFPNPTLDYFTLQYELVHSTEVTIQLINMNGDIVQTIVHSGNAGVNTLTVNIDNLAMGVYSLALTTDNYISVQKLIKIQ